ncbi:hypothetical protein EVAR_93429_1 [Eumeta japonica]|uniref:Uncharacterized protein n=1 Tax=Eumeta variegata TaxID=151549 RepID=A0A4C1UR78_EUMVA|nr:hypothetical protein EVAR_93429_1 [Eumeta japonica]
MEEKYMFSMNNEQICCAEGHSPNKCSAKLQARVRSGRGVTRRTLISASSGLIADVVSGSLVRRTALSRSTYPSAVLRIRSNSLSLPSKAKGGPKSESRPLLESRTGREPDEAVELELTSRTGQ